MIVSYKHNHATGYGRRRVRHRWRELQSPSAHASLQSRLTRHTDRIYMDAQVTFRGPSTLYGMDQEQYEVSAIQVIICTYTEIYMNYELMKEVLRY